MKPDLLNFNIAIMTVFPFRDKNEKVYTNNCDLQTRNNIFANLFALGQLLIFMCQTEVWLSL